MASVQFEPADVADEADEADEADKADMADMADKADRGALASGSGAAGSTTGAIGAEDRLDVVVAASPLGAYVFLFCISCFAAAHQILGMAAQASSCCLDAAFGFGRCC